MLEKKEFQFLGEDVRISDLAIIVNPKFAHIGNHIAIDPWVYISTQLYLEDYIHIAPHVSIIGGSERKLIMKNFTSIGSGTKIVVGGDDFNSGMINPTIPLKYRNPTIPTDIVMEEFSTIAVNCTVLPGIVLAEGSVIGANSLVLKNTEPWTIYAGSPARPIKKRNKDLILQYAKELQYK
jgi:acetyltransferase-like isoleucine patch superfamily enzyme